MCIEESSRRRKKHNKKECNGKNDNPDANGKKAEEVDGVLYDTGSYCNRRGNHGVCSRRSINRRFVNEIRAKYPGNEDKVRSMAILYDGQVKMAHLAIDPAIRKHVSPRIRLTLPAV